MSEEQSQVIAQRQQKAKDLEEQNVPLYPNQYRPQASLLELRSQYDSVSNEEFEKIEDVHTIAGRIMAKRDYGKSLFIDIKDHSDRIQVYFRKNAMPAEAFQLVKKLDIGDIIGTCGRLFKTKTGELTILATSAELVTKSLLPLPEKYHEMNVELKYRQRYVDLIMNDRAREVFRIRARIVTALRRFLDSKGFLEVETPMMQPIPGGATAKPFETYHQALGRKLYLRIAPELYLKRLLVGGFDRVYELNRNFRNEGISTKHNPEFTMLEFYQAYADYEYLMDLTEEMYTYAASEAGVGEVITYQGTEINMKTPWKRLAFNDSLVEMGGLTEKVLEDRDVAMAKAKELGAELPEQESHAKILEKLFDLTVEPNLIDPTYITQYPVEISPLSRRNDTQPNLTDRFELFIAGREMANGFSELNDPMDQKGRFLEQVAQREAGDQEALFMDEDYVRALMYGMPPAAGEGIGVDRLVMLFTDSASIKDVIIFPHQRSER